MLFVFDYGYKDTTFFLNSKFFLTFLYEMFWKWYCKRFPVRVKIIAYNAIVIFCHLVEVAIFAVSNFFSLFGIAVFNVPIAHIIVVLLFLLQSYCFFRYFQTFFNFFSLLSFRSHNNSKFCFACVPLLPVVSSRPLVSCVPVVCLSCVRMTILHNHTHAHTYVHTRAHIRTGIFRR